MYMLIRLTKLLNIVFSRNFGKDKGEKSRISQISHPYTIELRISQFLHHNHAIKFCISISYTQNTDYKIGPKKSESALSGLQNGPYSS